jgi:hypothetical protein
MKRLKKIFKIIGYSLLGLFILLIILTWAIPFFFKNDIKAMIEREADKALDAEFRFDIDKFELSIFRNFPNLSVSQGDVRIVGKGDFKGDTLLSLKNVRVSVNIWNILFGEEINVRGVYIDSPRIFAKVLKNGKANWDIVKPQPDTTQKKDDKPTKFRVGLRWWQIDNGVVEYKDQALGAFFRVDGLNHSGSGTVSESVFDLYTNTEMKRTNLAYEGSKYIENRYLAMDMVLNMNLPEQKYTFKRNTFKINDFSFGFDGFLQFVKAGIQMDLTYQARETQFKNVLSLVPSMYNATFSKLKTDGKFDFKGFVKGLSSTDGKKMPAFQLDLNVQDGMFQYPDLPLPVKNINFALLIDNKNGNIDQTLINLKKFGMLLGSNPIEARAKIEGLTNMLVDIFAKAQVNLGELTKIFPIQGTTIKGTYKLDALAKGTYNAQGAMPTINADMRLLDGFVKSSQYPEALESVNFVANVKNNTGKVNDTYLKLENFDMVLDKEPFHAKGALHNLDDAIYDFKVKGGIDLAKVIHVFPLEKTEMRGKIKADVAMEGKASYILKGEYTKAKTSGFVKMNDFFYKHTEYLPQTFRITNTNTTFTPQHITLESMDGFVGKSDFSATGKLSQYLEYVFNPDGILKGELNFKSTQFDSNEWIPASPEPTAQVSHANTKNVNPSPPPLNPSAITTSYVVAIPENIDFKINASVGKVLYDKYKLNNAKGIALLKNGIFTIQDATFDFLGGLFKTGLTYNPKDVLHPKYSFDFSINNLFLKNFSDVFLKEGSQSTKLAQNVVGKLNSLFKVSGELDQQLMPKFDKSMSGKFDLDLLEVVAENMPIAQSLGNFINTDELKKINLKDVLVRAEIKNGRVEYKPFDVIANDYKMNVSGGNSITGDLDFLLKTELPTDKLTMLGRGALGAFLGNATEGKKMKLNIQLGGTFSKPTTKLVGADGEATDVKGLVKDEIKKRVDEKKEEVKKEIKDEIKKKLADDVTPQVEAILKEAHQRAEQLKAEAKRRADEARAKADEIYNKALEDAYQRAYSEAPVLKEQAGKKARQLADKIALPIRMKAYQTAELGENEANRQADKIIQEAEIKADMYKKKASE